MDNQELEAHLDDLESDQVERKASLSDSTRIRQAICAFANDLPNHRRPGVVFVGANDDGGCAGTPITDQLLLTLSDMRSNGNILPLPSMLVQKRRLKGGDMAVVIVDPSDAPPVRFKGQVWIRVGPRRAIATQQEEQRLAERRRARDLPFDLRPLASASVEDLDLVLFRSEYLPSAVAPEVLEQNQRTILDQLASLRLLSSPPDQHPTVTGVLVAGKDPLRFVPGAYVQLLRLDGESLTDPIKDQREFSGPLLHVLRLLEESLALQISTFVDVTSAYREIRRPDYPFVALQQIVRNAVLHRDYESTNAPVRIHWYTDRVEVLSPGGPYGQVNRENFGRPGVTDYRNPHLAEAMRNLGYVQRFGLGIELARNELRKNGNPDLEYLVEEACVLATMRRRA